MTADAIQPASFRDPDGFIFSRDHILYRQVNKTYQKHYERLMTSGLYDHLVKAGLLITHDEIDIPPARPDIYYRIIRPAPVRFISYPYEWCFSQLKDAALVTLSVQKTSLEYGLTLKDASAYNIQFVHGRPLMIDTLSFEIYVEGTPWVAYRQFCRHFLAPLALMKYGDIRLGMMLRNYIDGLPLDLTSRLLPFRTWFRF
ncbi:MAG: SAM-dependent methyltransferase, partial [candidate division Zixibacteria bacterium]|nr:SAM-dependent methyltransferase [candidate division Zixibacteria bacterium]